MPQKRHTNSSTPSGRGREEPTHGAPGNIPGPFRGQTSDQHRGEDARRHTAPNFYSYNSFQAPYARYQRQSHHTVTPNVYHPHHNPLSGPHPPQFIPPPVGYLLPGVYPPVPYASAPTFGRSGFPLPVPYNFAQTPTRPGSTRQAVAPRHTPSNSAPSTPFGYLYPFTGGVPPGHLPHGPPLPCPIGRPLDSLDVLFDKWAAGPDYGPVLTPLEVGILDVKVQINPLLAPSADDALNQPTLEYNVLLPVSTARRTTDPPSKSWMAGRSAPATYPRVTKFNLISKVFSWTITIEAKDPKLGVTCSDVLHGIHDDMNRVTPRYQVEALLPRDFDLLMASYRVNRSTVRYAPGGEFGAAVKRGDFLHRYIMFDGVIEDDAFTMRKLVASGPGWKSLKKDDKNSRRGYPVTFVLHLDEVIVDPIRAYEEGSEPSTDANRDDT